MKPSTKKSIEEQRETAQKLTERERLEQEARAAQKNFAKSQGISEEEALRRFDALVSSNSDAQLRKFIKKYS